MAESETFEIALVVSGEGRAERAFENLKLRELEAKQEAQRLAAELRRLKQSGEATDQQMEALARAMIRAKQAASQYAAEARQIQAAQARATQATQAVVQATQAVSLASSNAGRTIGMTINTIAELGYSLSTAIPSLRTFGTQLAMMGGNAYSLGASFGPWGAALGAVIGLLPSAISLLNDTADAQDRAANAAKRHKEQVEDLVEAFERQREVERILSGEAASEDIEPFVRRERATRDVIQRELQPRLNEARAALARAEEARRNMAGLSFRQMVAIEQEVHRQRALVESLERSLANAEAGYQRALQAQTTAVQRELELSAELTQADWEMEEEDERDRRRRAERERRQAEARRRAQERAQEQEREWRELIEGLTEFSGSTELSVLAEIEEEERVSAQRAIAAIRGFFAERDRILQEEQRAIRNQGEVAAAEFSVFQQIGAGLGLASGRNDPFTLALEQREDAMRAHQMALRDLERQGTEWSAEAFNRRAQLYQQALSMQRAQARAAVEESAKFAGMAVETGLAPVVDLAGQMFRFVVEGSENTEDAFVRLLDQFLEATAVEYTIRALGQFAQAAAAAASLNPVQAAAHAAAGAMSLAVAAATGVAGAAIQPPPMPSIGGGGGGAQLEPSPGSGPQGPANITINIMTPNAILTEAERGSMVAQSIREARRQFGNRRGEV